MEASMLKGNYVNEPFDLKLALLRLVRNLHWILGVTLLGMLLFGGGYYIKNIVLQGEKQYLATSVYKVDYADEAWWENGSYINYMTWDTWVNSREMKDFVQKYLDEPVDESQIKISAKVDSDLRVPATMVTSASPELSLRYAAALEMALINDFPRVNSGDVTAIRVIDPALEAPEVHPDVRPVQAFALSGILSCFFALCVFFLKEWGEDSIWLPAQLYGRYGLRTVDTLQEEGLLADLDFFFQGKERIAVCSVDENTDTDAVCRFLEQRSKKKEWIPYPGILTDRQVCGKLKKEEDAVLLAVHAGHHAGKPLEYVLQLLDEYDCQVTCALLWGADERLIKCYYGRRGRSFKAERQSDIDD